MCVLYIDVDFLVSLSQLHALFTFGFHTTTSEERSIKNFLYILNSILFTTSVIFCKRHFLKLFINNVKVKVKEELSYYKPAQDLTAAGD
jgi:hypothetical protein